MSSVLRVIDRRDFARPLSLRVVNGPAFLLEAIAKDQQAVLGSLFETEGGKGFGLAVSA